MALFNTLFLKFSQTIAVRLRFLALKKAAMFNLDFGICETLLPNLNFWRFEKAPLLNLVFSDPQNTLLFDIVFWDLKSKRRFLEYHCAAHMSGAILFLTGDDPNFKRSSVLFCPHFEFVGIIVLILQRCINTAFPTPEVGGYHYVNDTSRVQRGINTAFPKPRGCGGPHPNANNIRRQRERNFHTDNHRDSNSTSRPAFHSP